MMPSRFDPRQQFGLSIGDIRRRANGAGSGLWVSTLCLVPLLGALVFWGSPVVSAIRLRGLELPGQPDEWALKLQAEGVTLRRDAGEPLTESQLKQAWECLQRAPAPVRTSSLKNAPLELISGASIQVHPRYREKHGEVPGRPGTDWSEVIGIAEDDVTIVLADQHVKYHGVTPCVLLHELGHQFDRQHGWISNSPSWRALHRQNTWCEYAAPYPEESFAEAFADYLAAPETRAKLPLLVHSFLTGHLAQPWHLPSGASSRRVLFCRARSRYSSPSTPRRIAPRHPRGYSK